MNDPGARTQPPVKNVENVMENEMNKIFHDEKRLLIVS